MKKSERLKKFARLLADGAFRASALLVPATCKICGTPLMSSESGLCVDCRESLPRTLYFRKRFNPMTDRFDLDLRVENATALLLYRRDNNVARVIKEFKYYGAPRLARQLGEMLGRELFNTPLLFQLDYLVPVPIHFTKRMKRGYNQTEQICLGMSRPLGLPLSTHLRAVRPHRTQTRKSLEQRSAGSGAHLFRVRKPEEWEGKHIMLVDDVCTTGATLSGVIRAIRRDVKDVRITVVALAATDL